MLNSTQKSVVCAEFERRSWMYEDIEYTLAYWARHEFRLYRALLQKNYKMSIENFKY